MTGTLWDPWMIIREILQRKFFKLKKIKKATLNLKAPGCITTAANKSALAEKTCSKSSLGDVMGSLLRDGDGTDDEKMGGSKDDQDGDDTG